MYLLIPNYSLSCTSKKTFIICQISKRCQAADMDDLVKHLRRPGHPWSPKPWRGATVAGGTHKAWADCLGHPRPIGPKPRLKDQWHPMAVNKLNKLNSKVSSWLYCIYYVILWCDYRPFFWDLLGDSPTGSAFWGLGLMPSGLTWSRLCLPNFKRNTVYQFLWPPDRATDVHDGHDGHDLCLAASQPEARGIAAMCQTEQLHELPVVLRRSLLQF